MYISLPGRLQDSKAPMPGGDSNTNNTTGQDLLTPNLHINLEVLAADIAELERTIFHLNRSNNELRAALEEDPNEKEYQQAIYENINVLAKKLEQLAKMKALQKKIMGAGAENLNQGGETQGEHQGETKCVNSSSGTDLLPGILL